MKMDEITQKSPADESDLKYEMLPKEQILSDTERILVEFTEDYKRMA